MDGKESSTENMLQRNSGNMQGPNSLIEPGQCVLSDDEINGGDVEDNLPKKGAKADASDDEISDLEEMKWGKFGDTDDEREDDNSDFSFNSDKLIDGYRDFVMTM